MSFLILSILASSAIFLLLKLFERKGVDNLKAIVVNYGTAGTLGLLLSSSENWEAVFKPEPIISIVILAFLFISMFTVMAKTTQVNGASVAVVANKLSVVIPFLMAILVLREELSWMKGLGLLLALLGVFFAFQKSDQHWKESFVLPLVLFLGSGLLDAVLKWSQTNYFQGDELLAFSSAIFFTACSLGVLMLFFSRKGLPSGKDFGFGLGLGVVNFFSIYLILAVLEFFEGNSSFVFPVNNLSIVLLTSLLSFLLLKEKLELRNWLGIALALIGIFVLSFETFILS